LYLKNSGEKPSTVREERGRKEDGTELRAGYLAFVEKGWRK